jgi:hypothetical protein
MAGDDDFLLRIALQAAVPLCLADLDAMPAEVRGPTRRKWAAEGVPHLAHRGEALQRRWWTGDGVCSAEVFTETARGIAALAAQPGGVVVFGALFCARHYPGGLHPYGEGVCQPCLTEDYDTPPEQPPYDDEYVTRTETLTPRGEFL